MNHPAAAQLSYLRDRARLAHLDGNGVLVNHLAAIAFEEIKRPDSGGSVSLPVSAWSWSVIFALYWLTDSYMLGEVEAVLKSVVPATDSERELVRVLRAYDWLVRQPLDPKCEKQRPELENAELKWADERDAIEFELLLTHVAELIWFRGPKETHLASLVARWTPLVPAHVAKRLAALQRRFEVQTSMVILGAPRQSDLRISSEWDTFPWVPRAWRCVFDSDFKGVDAILAEQSPRHTTNALAARMIFDFRHRNRLRGVFGDPQAIGLTRRRLLTSQSAELVFEDIRKERASAIVAGLYLSAANASDRFFGATLGMLLELAGLRRWDLAAWRDAVEIQSRLYAEFSAQEPGDSGFVTMAVAGAVAAFQLNDKDKWVDSTLARLEFLPAEELAVFVRDVLNANPIQYNHAKRVFAALGDAIPPAFHGDLARWAVRYVDHSINVDRFGMNIEKIEFLSPILSELSAEHEAWTLLWPIIESLFRLPILWGIGSSGSLLRRVLSHAPAAFVRKAVEIVLSTTGVADHEAGRWSLLCHVGENRPEIGSEFAVAILGSAPVPEDTLRLGELSWAKPHLATTNDQARLRAHTHLEGVIEHAIHPEGKNEFALSSHGWEVFLHVHWDASDSEWLGRLIAAIEHPRVLRGHLALLVQYLRSMVNHGPEVFAERTAARLTIWLSNPPLGIDPMGNGGGAFSSFRCFSGWSSEITEQLTYLAAAVRTKLGQRIDGELYQHLIRVAAQPPVGITGAAMLLTLEMAATDVARRAELFTVCQALLLAAQNRATSDNAAAEELMDGFRAQTWFATGTRQGAVSREILLELGGKIETLVSAVGQSSTPRVRGQVAAFLSALQSRDALTPQLAEMFAKLRKDPRVSVRRLAGNPE